MSSKIAILELKNWESSSRRGTKQYESSNHLGNVLAVVSDKKLGKSLGSGTSYADYYASVVVSASGYYPLGWEMLGRKVTSGKYRFSFNGKENDKEWYSRSSI